jgi:hypothetical protein
VKEEQNYEDIEIKRKWASILFGPAGAIISIAFA